MVKECWWFISCMPHRLPGLRRLFRNGLQLGFVYKNNSDQWLIPTFNLWWFIFSFGRQTYKFSPSPPTLGAPVLIVSWTLHHHHQMKKRSWLAKYNTNLPSPLDEETSGYHQGDKSAVDSKRGDKDHLTKVLDRYLHITKRKFRTCLEPVVLCLLPFLGS